MSASSFFTPMVVVLSLEACETMKTEMPWSARAEKIRLLTPITPTMPRPEMVTRQVSLIDEMPLMIFRSSWLGFLWISVPLAVGLKVFLMTIGMFLWNTGKMVGG